MDEAEQVMIAHPGIDAIGGPVPLAAFESLWEPKGWRIADDPAGAKKTTSRRAARAPQNEEG